MTVMTPREKWSDERLGDLNKKVDDLTTEMREGFARVDARFDALNRNLIGGLFAVIVALIGSNAF